ncbi:ABC transporter substrate-binding protein, partial [Escherichia sp. SS-MK2]
KDHKLSDPLATPPLASGPYRVTSWKMGQNIVYSRVKDYWAANLPVNRGRWNFDTIRYDYYLDDNVAFEAFKAGAFVDQTKLRYAFGHKFSKSKLYIAG